MSDQLQPTYLQPILAEHKVLRNRDGSKLVKLFGKLQWDLLVPHEFHGKTYPKMGFEIIARHQNGNTLPQLPELDSQAPETTEMPTIQSKDVEGILASGNTDDVTVVELQEFIKSRNLNIKLAQPKPVLVDEIKEALGLLEL